MFEAHYPHHQTLQHNRINLLLVDAVAATSGDDAFLFLGKDALTDAPGQISYGFEGNTTVVHLETAGAGFNTPEMEIQLLGNIDLVASDFIL